MAENYKRPGKKTTSPSPYGDWVSKQHTKKTRMLNVRIDRDLDLEWRKAVHKTNRTQTEIIIALVRAYVKYEMGANREIDTHIANLMEKREINDKKVISSALDDAIAMLKKREQNRDED